MKLFKRKPKCKNIKCKFKEEFRPICSETKICLKCKKHAHPLLLLRLETNTSQKKMASILDTTQGTISKIENFSLEPSMLQLYKIKNKFDIDCFEFVESIVAKKFKLMGVKRFR